MHSWRGRSRVWVDGYGGRRSSLCLRVCISIRRGLALPTARRGGWCYGRRGIAKAEGLESARWLRLAGRWMLLLNAVRICGIDCLRRGRIRRRWCSSSWRRLRGLLRLIWGVSQHGQSAL